MQWCILRTAASRTLPLAAALVDAGYDAWTPQEMQERRVGKRRHRVEQAVPVTPTIVFAGFDRVSDLVALSRSPAQTYLAWDNEQQRMVTRGVPYFTVFRYLDRYACVPDRGLDPLRLAEQRCKPRSQAPVYETGQQVLYSEAGFEGLTGTVEGSKGRFVLVQFAGFKIPVMVGAVSLLPVAA